MSVQSLLVNIHECQCNLIINANLMLSSSFLHGATAQKVHLIAAPRGIIKTSLQTGSEWLYPDEAIRHKSDNYNEVTCKLNIEYEKALLWLRYNVRLLKGPNLLG